MRFALAGINHRTAPVHLREKLAFRPDDIPAALIDAQARGASEALILSTCNRVEIAATLADGVSAEVLVDSLTERRTDAEAADLRPHVYIFQDREAVRHLFRVAASLDSMIVGEPQILGQLKQAYLQAKESGFIGGSLESLLTKAFSVAKRIRTETEIGQSAVSVSYAAVELAREIFGSLNKKRVLVIGAGKMSESTARHLLRAGATEILITNRTIGRAEELAQLFRGEVIPYEHFPSRLSDVDIVITSSSAPAYVLKPDMVRSALDNRKNKPMFLIDIAVPRNIDPAINSIEHAFLYDIDDLQGLASQNLKTRKQVAQQAETIVAEELSRYEARLRERDLAPTIVSFQAQLEDIRREVLERFRPKMGALTPQQEQALEQITRGIISKVAHGPISELRRHAAARESEPELEQPEMLLTAVRRMFRLPDR
jgi:glutamyl-tRNA reductase